MASATLGVMMAVRFGRPELQYAPECDANLDASIHRFFNIVVDKYCMYYKAHSASVTLTIPPSTVVHALHVTLMHQSVNMVPGDKEPHLASSSDTPLLNERWKDMMTEMAARH